MDVMTWQESVPTTFCNGLMVTIGCRFGSLPNNEWIFSEPLLRNSTSALVDNLRSKSEFSWLVNERKKNKTFFIHRKND